MLQHIPGVCKTENGTLRNVTYYGKWENAALAIWNSHVEDYQYLQLPEISFKIATELSLEEYYKLIPLKCLFFDEHSVTNIFFTYNDVGPTKLNLVNVLVTNNGPGVHFLWQKCNDSYNYTDAIVQSKL